MAPWPHQTCPYPECGQLVRDLLTEMVSNADQATEEFRALVRQLPGGAITCPFCQGAIEYDATGSSLVVSARKPLKYSRLKMETRARDYGNQSTPPVLSMTPEEWAVEEKMMVGPLRNYVYAEDVEP